MLRTLLAGLLLANLVFFGWARGWFAPAWPAPGAGEREPARLAAQLAPERITVLTPAAASAALALQSAGACLQAGPFDTAQTAAAEARLVAAGLSAGSWTWAAQALAGPADLASSAPAAAPTPVPAAAAAAAPLPGRWLTFPAASAGLAATLATLEPAGLAGGFKPCATRP